MNYYTSQENLRVLTFVKLEKIGLKSCYALHFEFDNDYILPALILDLRKHHFSMYFFFLVS